MEQKKDKDYLGFCEEVLSGKVQFELKTLNVCGASLSKIGAKGMMDIPVNSETFDAVKEVYGDYLKHEDENTVILYAMFRIKNGDRTKLPNYEEWKKINNANKTILKPKNKYNGKIK